MAEHDDDSTEEERADAARLRDALETLDVHVRDDDAKLARALRAAFGPEALPPAELDSIVDLALASDAELAVAASLRDEGAHLVDALAAAWRPKALAADAPDALAAKALRKAPGRRNVIVRVTFGAVGVLALAASIALLVHGSAANELPLACTRTTQPLFREPFGSRDASARIDTIAMARASEYRNNRFAKWGVR